MKKEKLLGLAAATTAVVATLAPMKADARPCGPGPRGGFGGHHGGFHAPMHHGGFRGPVHHGGPVHFGGPIHHIGPRYFGGPAVYPVGPYYGSYYNPYYYDNCWVNPAPVVVSSPVVVSQPYYQQPVQVYPQPITQPAPAPVVQQTAAPQPIEVKTIVEHRYLTAEEARAAAEAAAQNQRQ